MTIAMCYLTPEGVVLGADSTASAAISPGPGYVGYHYFNHNQKVFELGEDSTAGVLTWGLGGLTTGSHRTLLALLADDIQKKPATDLADITSRWVVLFCPRYSADPAMTLCKALATKKPFDPNASPPDPAARTKQEEGQFEQLKRDLVAGFCIGGYVLPDRTRRALKVIFEPLAASPPAPTAVAGNGEFWGAPNMIQRLIFGADDALKQSILSSGKWGGTAADLIALLDQHKLAQPLLPIRDAIDFVHACIYSTIKALKFSALFQICGGPVEIAVITSDRRFRWVRHKTWDVAITEGSP